MPSVQNVVYDIIFAGGGTSACITAGRLAAADPTLKILCQPSEALLGRSPLVPSGRAVGGGSNVNFVVYTRASASDYDDWETKYGNKGWSSKHIIPLLKKAETFQPGSTNSTHGSSGPIKMSYAPDLINIAENFLEVAASFDKERTVTDDTNAFFECEKYIDGETGRRSGTAHHYIYNQAQNTNLTVLDRHRVVRIIFEGKHAVGIEYVSDLVGRNGGITVPITARVSRLVVVSAGAFGSPAILERSGIGTKSILEKNNVQQIVDLPGVGGIFLSFIATENADTLDQLFRGSPEEVEPYAQQWLKEGKGLMSHHGIDCGVKMRPNVKELASMSPEFDHRWKTHFAPAPDKPVMLYLPFAAWGNPFSLGGQVLTSCSPPFLAMLGLNPAVPRGKYFTITYFSVYPVSLGRVHITSGSNPYAKSDFHAGFLDE
ncbi:hypothetical protein GALMADRAFT_256740 [Galerina marginata CBS 339.88]|uniref:Glucose-methanol-choline oxidoreductase N-terminal domain-containing protein n=1 Tax=Galerina marginata (strain CBS 339.88) TaxID=685588 RepID=A0A067SP36_GALM3|nr:hypothetical protein GALMADRAFT_256740 [Galerina marginata CBS 339.88]